MPIYAPTWANGTGGDAFATLTTSGANITQAVRTSSGALATYSCALVTLNSYVNLAFTFAQASGAPPVIEVASGVASGPLREIGTASVGFNTFAIKKTESPFFIWFWSKADGDWSATGLTLQRPVSVRDTSGKNTYRQDIVLAPTSSIVLPDAVSNKPAHGFITCAHASDGSIVESAEFEYGSSGTVNLIRGTSNVVANAATASKVQIGAATPANPVVITNATAAALNTMIVLHYS